MEQTIVVEWPQFVGPHAGWWQLHGWFCVNDDDDDDDAIWHNTEPTSAPEELAQQPSPAPYVSVNI